MQNTVHFPFSTILIVIFISLSAILLSGSANQVYACEASPPGAPSQDMIDNSAAVFSGKVIKFENVTLEDPAGDKRIAFFQADRYWKTPSTENDYNELVVITEIHHAACGYDFEEGKSYLVYAGIWWYAHDSLYTGLGYGTQPIEDAQEHLAFLGEGKIPTREGSWNEQINSIDIKPLPKPHEEATAVVLSIVGVGAAVAGASAFFSLRRLRKN